MKATLGAILIVFGFAAFAVGQITLQINSPANLATVQGTVTISGTTTGLSPTGRVAVSIAGGPFQLASGTANWSFVWDTTTVVNSTLLVRVRARENIFSPATLENVIVTVANGAASGPAVSFLQPADGATVLDTLTVIGASSNATLVELSVDGGAFDVVNGLDPWNAVFEPGSLAPGPHVLTARASDGTTTALASRNIVVGMPPAGDQTFAYVSSVDGEAMTSRLWLPQGFDPSAGLRPLFVYLHGGGGNGVVLPSNAAITGELDARGWIGIAPDGRLWGLGDIGCNWTYSSAYVDNPDPNVGPGEQDIFDAIEWAVQNLPVDPDRIYLSGFSMGGRGAYIIGLKNPDRFAAIAPLGAAADMYEIYERRPQNAVCKEGMTGGEPGDSDVVDTMYTITSGRFLLENAFNLPTYVGHGLNDTVASNTLTASPFLHGLHLTTDTSWSGCHGTTNLCFGHTPTLSELAARHPEGYDWAHMFTPVGHVADALWFTGSPAAPGIMGTPDPASPGDLIGVFDFLAGHTQVKSPETIVYKNYTDTHDRAYWLELVSAVPWTDVPAGVRVTRDLTENALSCETVRAAELRFDLPLAGLSLDAVTPLKIDLSELVEPVFDPALDASGEALAPSIVLELGGPVSDDVVVLRDGLPLPAAEVVAAGTTITIAPVAINGPTQLEVFGCAGYHLEYGQGFAGSGGFVPRLEGGGCATGGGTITAEVTGALGGASAVLLVGPTPIEFPLATGGDLLAGPLAQLTLVDFGLTGVGPGNGQAQFSLALPPGQAADSFVLQALILDDGGAASYALSNGLRFVIN